MQTWKSWYMTGTKSLESWTSNSTKSAPYEAAVFSDAMVFSRTSAQLKKMQIATSKICRALQSRLQKKIKHYFLKKKKKEKSWSS